MWCAKRALCATVTVFPSGFQDLVMELIYLKFVNKLSYKIRQWLRFIWQCGEKMKIKKKRSGMAQLKNYATKH